MTFLKRVLTIFGFVSLLLCSCNKPSNDQTSQTLSDSSITSIEPDSSTTSSEPGISYHTVVWLNYDHSLLYKDTHVEEGDIPVYKGETPVKKGNQQYSYKFTGWTPTLVPAYIDATYTAVFEEVTNEYSVTWQDDDGTILKTENYEYGDFPSYNFQTPAKASSEQYAYSFSGWKPALQEVTKDAVYTATYSQSLRKYQVTWKNYDGSTLSVETYSYGEIPSYKGTQPRQRSDAQFDYTFVGWSPSIVPVKTNADYVAQFNGALKSYTVTWSINGNKTSETYNYGETPSYKGEYPTKQGNAQYFYTFSGWSPEITSVTGDITYTALFSQGIKGYRIEWQNYDGSVLEVDENIIYGSTPTYDGSTPVRPQTAQYTYSFSGWSPSISNVKGDTVYVAQYSNKVNRYTITWKNDDGTVINTTQVEYGSTPTHADPVSKSAGSNRYGEFTGWSPEITSVTEDTTYIATYEYKECSQALVYEFDEANGAYSITGVNSLSLLNGKNLVIPSHYNGYPVTTIKGYVFSYYCPESITIPQTIKKIESYAFDRCYDRLKHIVFEKCSNLLIETAAFYYCNYADYTYYGTLENWLSIEGKKAFDSESSIVHLYLDGDTNETTSIIIPDSIERIGTYAFAGCRSLTSVTLSTRVINEYAFSRCRSLTSVILNEGVRTIECEAFSACPLTSLVLPSTAYDIKTNALRGLSKLEELTIPFVNCRIYYLFDNHDYYENNPYIPDSLKKIVVSEGCETIVDNGFSKMAKIETVVLPLSLKTIGDGAFSGCSSLTNIDIPYGVTRIGRAAFMDTAITSITIPETVTSISDSAFSGCSSLATMYFESLTPPSTKNGNIFGSSLSFSGFKMYVPAESVSVYKTTYSFDVISSYIFGYTPHSYSEETVITPATCTTAGKKVQTCTDCGKTRYVIIPAFGHDWDEGVVPETPESDIHMTYTCSRCNQEFVVYNTDLSNTKYHFDITEAIGFNTPDKTMEGLYPNNYARWDIVDSDYRVLVPGYYRVAISMKLSSFYDADRHFYNEYDSGDVSPFESPYRYWIDINGVSTYPDVALKWGDMGFTTSEFNSAVFITSIYVPPCTNCISLIHGDIEFDSPAYISYIELLPID